jgi:polyisoprenoid-binding protein YceI
MKKIFYIIIAIIVAVAGVYAVTRTPDPSSIEQVIMGEVGDSVTSPEDGVYRLDTEKTQFEWEGRKKLIRGYVDRGSLSLSEGSFEVRNGTIVTGSVVFDMNTIEVGSTGRQTGETVLERHLKSDDFFAVETYPTARITLTEVTPIEGVQYGYIIKGDLTVKNVTESITFPARIYSEEGVLYMEASTEVDRTLWNIHYGSDKFFSNLADNVIDDFFTARFKVVAEKEL